MTGFAAVASEVSGWHVTLVIGLVIAASYRKPIRQYSLLRLLVPYYLKNGCKPALALMKARADAFGQREPITLIGAHEREPEADVEPVRAEAAARAYREGWAGQVATAMTTALGWHRRPDTGGCSCDPILEAARPIQGRRRQIRRAW